MKNLLLLCLVLLSVGCSHSIKIKGARFISPKVSDTQWGGYASLSLGADTRITLIDDVGDNPPTRNPVRINQDPDAGDLLGLNYIGLEAGVSPLKRTELYYDNGAIGIKWQLLNFEPKTKDWVASILAGYGDSSQGSTFGEDSDTSEAESEIDRTQYGFSVGYVAKDDLIIYTSYLNESYDVETTVNNTSGKFGPYKDEGNHQIIAIGLTTPQKGFLWSFEYNHIIIDWDRANDKKDQNLVAGRMGYSW